MGNASDEPTPEELIAELRECVEKDFYFEICSGSAKILLDYIQKLQGTHRSSSGQDTGPSIP